MYNVSEEVDFSHLQGEQGFFPFSCWSGYFFLWNNHLVTEDWSEEENEAEQLLRKELKNLKNKKTKAKR